MKVLEDLVGPYETAVITSDDPQAVVDWLVDNEYQLGDTGPELLSPYVEEGYYFLALRLAPDRGVGDLSPIAITYKAERPGIPIRLTAVAVQPDMPIFVWILGDHRAIPVNHRHVRVNQELINWAVPQPRDYTRLVTAAVGEAGGQGFVTDFAGDSDLMDGSLNFEDLYDIDRLRNADMFELTSALDRFPQDSQMDALLRRHLPISKRVLEEGMLQVWYRGDQEKYDQAVENGWLLENAESWYYGGNMSDFAEYMEIDDYDVTAFLDELEAVVVEPLKTAQRLFDEYPYLTRLFTTLSAEEMTVDPMFDFNPDLPDMARQRSAFANSIDCRSNDLWEWGLVLKFSDGRVVRTEPWADLSERSAPAAALIEQMHASGPPEIIWRATAVVEEEVNSIEQMALTGLEGLDALASPNPFNPSTTIYFQVPEAEEVSLVVYNLAGQVVRTLIDGRSLEPGIYDVFWEAKDQQGRNVAAGVYLYRLSAGEHGPGA